jgi:hypothetical protein
LVGAVRRFTFLSKKFAWIYEIGSRVDPAEEAKLFTRGNIEKTLPHMRLLWHHNGSQPRDRPSLLSRSAPNAPPGSRRWLRGRDFQGRSRENAGSHPQPGSGRCRFRRTSTRWRPCRLTCQSIAGRRPRQASENLGRPYQVHHRQLSIEPDCVSWRTFFCADLTPSQVIGAALRAEPNSCAQEFG